MNLLALGLAGGAFLGYRAARGARGTGARRFAERDPDGQGFDEVSDLAASPAEPLEVEIDAMASEDVEMAADLVALENEIESEESAGENWVEALETNVIENAEPGRPLDTFEGEPGGRTPRVAKHHDTPIADLGSGGRRGL
jgi:hypothetical protein